MTVSGRMSALFVAVFLAAAPAWGQGNAGFNTVRRSLVKVYARTNPPDIRSPWQKRGMGSSIGSGVIIEGNRILTNAHTVANQVNVEVKREGVPRRYSARVLFAGHDCDLALLAVDDEEFFDGSLPLPIGETPYIRDPVTVYGFPVGGDTVSVTSGIVSRIEVSTYAHSARRLLLVQIDAAINPGNSGGPVVAGGKMSGIAVQAIRAADNVGYMVPVDIIRHFLADIEDGIFDGFPSLGIGLQPIENPSLKESLGLKGRESGVLVTKVNFGSSAWGKIEDGDVILSVDGVPIGEDLSVPWREDSRINFGHLVHRRQIGDRITMSTLRRGRIRQVELTLNDADPLIPPPSYDTRPSYYIVGGLVFQPLTADYMRIFKRTPPEMSYLATERNLRTEERRELVFISQVLASPMTRGYQRLSNVVVDTVQGEVPGDMQELADILDDSTGRWLTVKAMNGTTLVLDLAEARDKTAGILKTYGIPADRSTDLAGR